MRFQHLSLWLLLLIAFGCSTNVSAKESDDQAGEDPSSAKADGPSLVVGDKAPQLQDVKWLKGGEIESYKSGKVYVAEFWATWCGPCIASMPHLDHLAKEYAAEGFDVVTVTTDGPSNSLDKVTEFIEGPGKDYAFHYAFCNTEATHNAYMKAAQRNGIPCSFVIDRSGNIAFIGHPMDLDTVLPMVIDGTWRGKADADLYVQLGDEMSEAPELAKTDPKKALAVFDEVEKRFPKRAETMQFVITKALTLKETGDFDALAALLKGMEKKALEEKDARTLLNVAGLASDESLQGKPAIESVGKEALEAGVKLVGDDWNLKIRAAMIYKNLGDKDTAKKLADEAFESIPDARTKSMVKGFIDQQFGDDEAVESEDKSAE